jgi:uncharacterized protein with GYD domain
MGHRPTSEFPAESCNQRAGKKAAEQSIRRQTDRRVLKSILARRDVGRALAQVQVTVGKYDIFFLCNACGDSHSMGISVTLENGPASQQSIAEVYAGKDLPSSLSMLKGTRVYCPKTGRHYSQKDNTKIFLVPAGR